MSLTRDSRRSFDRGGFASDAFAGPGVGKLSLVDHELTPRQGPSSSPLQTRSEDPSGGGVPGASDPLSREHALIHNALADGPNAGRARVAYRAIEQARLDHPELASRLTPEIVAMLVNGVAVPRGGERGIAGVLGSAQAGDAAQTLLQMPPEAYQQLVGLLDEAGTGDDGQPAAGADAGTEQALLLEALAARRTLLLDPAADRSMVTRDPFLQSYSDQPGQDPPTSRDPMAEIAELANAIRGGDRAEVLQATSLIGLDPGTRGGPQTYTRSCAPRSALNAYAEIDPALAFMLRAHPERIAELELAFMTDQGQEAADRTRGTVQPGAQNGTAVRDAYTAFGVNTAQSITDPRAARGATNVLGVDPDPDLLDAALAAGEPVPIRTFAFSSGDNANPGGHYLLALDVRRDREGTRYLISEPWTGRTAWVTAEQLADGTLDQVFGAELAGGVQDIYVEPDLVP